MDCCYCGFPLSSLDYCTNCKADVRRYKKIIYTANRLYNEGLDRATVRDLSGAVNALKNCLKCDKNNIDARNLLGLVYYEMGEAVSAFVEWTISRKLRPEKNIASEYLDIVQSNQGRIEILNITIRKYNIALKYCREQSNDLAIIQLQKVIKQNPKYVRARQLLALLYIEKEEWSRAKRELNACMEIDNGDLNTRRYLREIELQFGDEERSRAKRARREKHSAVTIQRGTETIIQPVNPRENIGAAAFLQIAIGLFIGVFAAYFIVMPGREAKVRDEVAADVVALNEQIETRNLELSEKNARIVELEEDNSQLQDNLNAYSGTGGVVASYDQLISAAFAYMDYGQGDMAVEEYLDLIPVDFVESKATPAYVELYNYLRGGIGDSVATSYYDSGMEAYRVMDYPTAISHLTKAFSYDDTNDSALYYLGLSYFESGDITHAEETFQQLLAVFPQSEHADNARRKIEEIGE